MHQLIRASAGSGKTFRLSNHFLRQLFLGHAPETILATTFTRKAADEILGRVLMRLATAAQDETACQELARQLELPDISAADARTLLAEVTGQLHRMRVCTLDSFFQQVARSLTLELGLPPGWSIIDDHTDANLRQQAIDAVLAQQLPKDSQRLMQMLAKGRSKRSVRDLIDETVSNFHELFLLTDRPAWQRIPEPRRLTNEAIEQALSAACECDLPTRKNAADTRIADIERFRAADWETFLTKGFAKPVFDGSGTWYGKPLPADLAAAYEQLVAHAKAEILDAVRRQTDATYHLIERFDREYTRLRSEHGWMRFNDVTRTLARSRGAADGHRMNFRLDSSIRHLLLDEFQDTSPDQWAVLKRLALNITGQKDGSTFFCVGDPKQAIYGWRGGVAEILDAVEDAVADIQPVSLDESRRSAPAVIETVNRVFRHVVDHTNLDDCGVPIQQWSNAFPDHTTAKGDAPGFAQLRTSPAFGSEPAEDAGDTFCQWAAKQIQHLHEQVPAAGIGVLTRRRSTVARLVHELTLLGVAASEEGGTAPTDSPAVLAIMSLLKLASHPGCEVSRFHVATSPLADVAGLHSWDDDAAAADAAAVIRARLTDDGYGRTLQWLTEAVRPFCSQRDVLRLRQIVIEGWRFDQSPSLNPAEFIRYLESSRLSKSEAASVRVMTVHQSKGLEFDIVVLPELQGTLFRPRAAAVGGPGGDQPVDSVCLWRSKDLRPLLPFPLQQAFDQTIRRDVSESLCLLYVALTRARHALHMLVEPHNKGKPPRTFSGLLMAALSHDQQSGQNEVLYETGDEYWFNSVPELQRAARTAVKHTMPAVQAVRMKPMPEGRVRGLRREAPSRHEPHRLYLPIAPLTADEQKSDDQQQATVVPTRVDPRIRGTLIHAWFECVQWLDEQPPPAELRLREIAAGLAVPEPVVDELLPQFDHMLQLPNVRTALSRSNALRSATFVRHASGSDAELRVENERPFVLRREGAIVQGTIDRLVLLVRKGRPVAAEILDFKTDRLTGDAASWTNDRLEYYRPQLAAYREAVSQCFRVDELSIATRLILLEADAVVTVDVAHSRS